MAKKKLTLISLSEARVAGLKRYFTGKQCKNSHISERFVANRHCIECHNQLLGVDRDKHRANFRRWYEKNVESQRKKMRDRAKKNKHARSVYSRKYRSDHLEEHAAYQRNRNAAKTKNGGTHTAADIRKILKLQNGRCAGCLMRLGKYHVDHIVPISRGGTNWPDNLQVLCIPCNLKKRNRDPVEFMREIGRLL